MLQRLTDFLEGTGDINFENWRCAFWVSLPVALALGGFFAVVGMVLADSQPIFMLDFGARVSTIVAGAMVFLLKPLTSGWLLALRSALAVGFGCLVGIWIPILLYWAHSELNGKIEFVALVAVLLIISGIFDYRNDRLDQMKTKDWHSVGPPPV